MAVFSEASLMLDWKGDRCLQFARHLQETVRNGVRQRGGRRKKKKAAYRTFFSTLQQEGGRHGLDGNHGGLSGMKRMNRPYD